MVNLADWLEAEEVSGFRFAAERWTERPFDAQARAEAVGREVLANYANRDWLARRMESMGYERLAQHLRDTVLPPSGNTRTGDFGEIVGTFLLRQHKEFFVPVLRLRYKDAPDGTQRLIDIVAFQFRKPPGRTVVAVCEVKTRSASDPSIAVRAADQLAAAVKDLPLSLSFMDRRLTDEGKHQFADLVAALLDPDADYHLEQHVCAVTDTDVVHAEVFDRLEDPGSYADVKASVVLLAGMAQLISDSYDSASRLDGFAS
ncbi:MAG TPA: Hachiman antiphage defense system protein HamA [Solirubrobacterales bacterium]|nr:Hachiman antiphage defense system protein HamA [Solirubrobacterales bacterium]